MILLPGVRGGLSKKKVHHRTQIFLLPRIQKHRILESLNRRIIMELSSTQLEQVIDIIENNEHTITEIAKMFRVSEDVIAIAYEEIFG